MSTRAAYTVSNSTNNSSLRLASLVAELEILDVDEVNLLTFSASCSSGALGLKWPTSSYALSFASSTRLSIEATGTLKNLNALLSDLTYTSAVGTGSKTAPNPTVALTVVDGSLSNTKELTMSVSPQPHAPAITLPAAVSTAEDSAVVIGASVNSEDLASIDAITISLSAAQGTVSVSSGAVVDVLYSAGSSDTFEKSVSFRASVADANAILASLSYTPSIDGNSIVSGQDTVTLTATDTKSIPTQVTSASTLVTVGAVNDPPVVIVSGSVATDKATQVALTDLIAFSDAEAAGLYTATMTATFGSLKLPSTTGLYTSSSGWSTSLTFSGSMDNLNAAVRKALFKPVATFVGMESLTITITDPDGSTLSATVAVTVNDVNDLPVISLPATTVSMDEDTVYTLSGVSLSDSDSPDLKVTLSATQGALACPGESSSSSACEFLGTVSEVNDKVKATTFMPPADFNSVQARSLPSVTVTVFDTKTTSASSIMSIYVNPVNDAPEVSAPASLVVSASGETDIYSVTVSDVDADEGGGSIVSVTVTTSAGTLTLAKLAGLASGDAQVLSTSVGTASLVIRGTLASVNAAMSPLTYAPSSTSSYASETITIAIDDEGNTGGSSLLDSATVDLVVSSSATDSVTPTLSTPTSSTLVEDTAIDFTGFSITSPAAGEGPRRRIYEIY